MRIVFMGTPDFALFSLKALCASRHDVLAVVTQPDRPGSRGVVRFSSVKEYATEREIPVLQYEKVGKEGVDDLRALGADLFVTAAFGQILTQDILELPKFGVVNVHASLLPKYRGSSPIQWAIINGEKETGVTVMQTAVGLDTGDILLQKSIPIEASDTTETMFEKLGALGAEALIEYIDRLECGESIVRRAQREEDASYFPMLKKSDGKIDWSRSAESICNRVRGVTPWPGAYAVLRGKTVKLFDLQCVDGIVGDPGAVVRADKNGWWIACGKGGVCVGSAQAEGKRRMSSTDFINGSRIAVGEVLE